MSQTDELDLSGLSLQELTRIAEVAGEPAFRGRQLYHALYAECHSSVAEITTLPLTFREWLGRQGYTIQKTEIERKFCSEDGTIRYLLRFADGQSVETVWMPEGDGGEHGDGSEENEDPSPTPTSTSWRAGRFHRATICVSSQAGCAVDCQFCMTALLGLQRNLSSGEIVGQVLTVLRDRGVKVGEERINLVFMGQGEPFLNYDSFMGAVRLLAGDAIGIPVSRMTVSTSGIVPRIFDFAKEEVRPKLAISLNASNDTDRERLMPITRKWNLEKLLAAARSFPLRNRERLTFEYVLLDGVNDSEQHAHETAELLRGIRAKVNLIALNPGEEIPFQTPAEARVRAFQRILIGAGLPTFIRRPRGLDIYAACGQLKRTVA